MSRQSFDPRQDQRTVAKFDQDRDQFCRAEGCPRWWSVKLEGKSPLCSAHAWADPRQWPAITQKLLDEDADKAYHRSEPPPLTEPRRDPARLRAIMERLKNKTDKLEAVDARKLIGLDE